MPTFIALDVETANADMSSICQIGVASFEGGKDVYRWETLIDPDCFFDSINVSIHGIDEDAVSGAPSFAEVFPVLVEMISGKVVVTHTSFDRTAIQRACNRHSSSMVECTWLDSSRVARRAWPEVSKRGYGLSNLAARLGIVFEHHNALQDALAAGQVLTRAVTESGKDLDWWMHQVSRRINPARASHLPDVEINLDGDLFGETVVFTGSLSMSRVLAEQTAMLAGCAVSKSVNKRVTLLVVGDQDATKLAGHEKSSKHRKGEELILAGQDIRIVGESDFLLMVGAHTEPDLIPDGDRA